MRDRSPCRIERSSQVEVDHALESDVVRLLDITTSGPPADQAGQHVESPESLGHLVDEGGCRFAVGAVDSLEKEPILWQTQQPFDLVGFIRDEIGDRKTKAAARQSGCYFSTQSARSSGDYCNRIRHVIPCETTRPWYKLYC